MLLQRTEEEGFRGGARRGTTITTAPEFLLFAVTNLKSCSSFNFVSVITRISKLLSNILLKQSHSAGSLDAGTFIRDKLMILVLLKIAYRNMSAPTPT